MLGYPTHTLSSLKPHVGYPSALLKCCKATVKEKCARFPRQRGRLINFAPGLRIRSGQVDMRVRYLGRGEMPQVKDRVLSKVSSVCLKMETPKNLVSFFCQNSVLTN